jgi:outer membrane immunogenic protein
MGQLMKNGTGRVLLSGVALLALFATAHAADMATKIPLKAPPAPTPAYDWSGFYLGGYYGASWSQSNASTPAPFVGNANPGGVDINSSSWTAGVTAGYNLQLAPVWLVGVEGDFGYLGGGQLFQEFDDSTTAGEKNRWYATPRGRVGYVTGPSVIYVTGGVGFVHVTDTFGGSTGLPFSAGITSSTTTTGGVVGAASRPNCRAIGRRRPNISMSMAAAIIPSCPTRLDRPRRRRQLSRIAFRSSRPA